MTENHTEIIDRLLSGRTYFVGSGLVEAVRALRREAERAARSVAEKNLSAADCDALDDQLARLREENASLAASLAEARVVASALEAELAAIGAGLEKVGERDGRQAAALAAYACFMAELRDLVDRTHERINPAG